LQDQPFQVLAMLIQRPGEMISRKEFRETLWSADTFVNFDTGLNTAIKKLRDALSDSSDEPRYIETLPKRGYRLIVPVENVAPHQGTDVQAPLSRANGQQIAEPVLPTVPRPTELKPHSRYWRNA